MRWLNLSVHQIEVSEGRLGQVKAWTVGICERGEMGYEDSCDSIKERGGRFRYAFERRSIAPSGVRGQRMGARQARSWRTFARWRQSRSA